jgi:hypothetical protein
MGRALHGTIATVLSQWRRMVFIRLKNVNYNIIQELKRMTLELQKERNSFQRLRAPLPLTTPHTCRYFQDSRSSWTNSLLLVVGAMDMPLGDLADIDVRWCNISSQDSV